MKTNKKAIMALVMVLVMLAVPLTVMDQSETIDAASVVPTPVDYAYKITYYETDEVVGGVQHYQSEIKAVYKDGNISGSTSPEDPVKYKNNGWILDEGSWSWNTTTGLGPFNMFYAAISKGTSDANALSDTAGMISYILNPYDLSQAIKYKAGDGSYTMANYNIMLVIPTVYWYSDGSGNLYISNSNSNPNLTADVNSNMVAYAHTADTDADGDLTEETPYPYLALSVYEATETSSKIGSRTGVTPVNNQAINTIRGKLDTSDVGTYQLWNFYEWTLYKILAQAAIGSKDAQSVIGNGYDSSTDGTGMQTTGLGNAAGPYGSSGTAETKNAYAWSKLFIENSWGSGWEFVDNTYLGSGAIFAGTALTTDLSSTSVAVTGAEYVPTSSRLSVPASMSQNDIRYQSMASATWDMPVADGTSWSKDASSPKGAASDSIWTNNNQNSCLIVGGSWNDGAFGGLSAWASNYVLSNSATGFGARLAYLMTADAAVADSSYTITFAEQSRTTSIVNSTKTAIVLPEPAPLDDEEFSGWYLDSQYTKYVGPAGSYFTPTGQSTVLYAKYSQIHTKTLTFHEWGGSSYSDAQSSAPLYDGDVMYMPAPKTGSVIASSLGYRFVGWETGTAGTTTILTSGSQYRAGSMYPAGELSSTSTMDLYAVYELETYKITYYSWNGTTYTAGITVDVPAGQSIQLPDPAELSGYTFSAWYTGSAGSSGTKIGSAGEYYTPTATGSISPVYTAISNCVITFNADGTELSTKTTAQRGSQITLPEAPGVADKLFYGWCTESASGTLAGLAGQLYTVPSSATITLYAKYVEAGEYNTVTVYSGTSGGISDYTLLVKKGESMILPQAAEISGYNFSGWYTDSARASSLVGLEGQYWTPSTLFVLYPKYTAISSNTVTYYVWDGEGSTISDYGSDYQISVIDGERTQLPSPKYFANYEFKYWATDPTSSATQVGTAGYMYKPSSATTSLYPVYGAVESESTYTVTIYSYNGSEYTSGATVKVVQGSAFRLPEATERPGYAFSHWVPTDNGTGSSIGTAGQYYTPATTGSISPVYVQLKTVTFDRYKSTSPYYEVDYTVLAGEGSQIVLPSAAVRDGYVHAGWTTAYGDVSKLVGAAGAYYTVPANNVTLYPYYTEGSTTGTWTVTFYEGSSSYTLDYTVDVTKGYSVLLPEAAQVSGKTFSHWATSDGAATPTYTSVGTTGQYYKPTDAVPLYPIYADIEVSSLTVSYQLNGVAADVSSYLIATLSSATCEVDGYVYLTITKVPGAVCSYTVTSSNAYVVPMVDDLYRLYVKSSSATTVIVNVDNRYTQGYEDFFISGFTNQGQSVTIKLRGDSEAGLPAGTLSLGGVYCRYDGTLGYYVYGSIENLGTVTYDDQTVSAADSSAICTATLPVGYQVYYAYGIFDVLGTKSYCGGMLGPAAVTLEL